MGHFWVSSRKKCEEQPVWHWALDLEAAKARACRELGCGTALPCFPEESFTEGLSLPWHRELELVGNEPWLASCPRVAPCEQLCSRP